MRIPECEACEKLITECDNGPVCKIARKKIQDLEAKNHNLYLQVLHLKDFSKEAIADIAKKEIPVDEKLIQEWWKHAELYPTLEKVPEAAFKFCSLSVAEGMLLVTVYDLFRKHNRGRIYSYGSSFLGKLKSVYDACIRINKLREWESSFTLTPEEAINENSDDNMQP